MDNKTLKEKTAKGFLWGALNQGSMQVLNALFGIVLARNLSQDDYGLVGMLTIFTLIATSLQDSGFVTALTNKRDATHLEYNSVFWFNIGVSACLYVILFLSAPAIARFYHEPLLVALARYLFIGFFIASFSIVPRAILFKQLKQRELAIMGFIALVISGSVGVTMALNHMAYWGIATQTITFNLCVSILSWYFSGWRPSLQISFRPIREMFGFSSKMLVTYVFNQINNNIFSIVLGKAYSKTETGYYTQANKWNTMGHQFITGMVSGVAQPMFVQVGDDPERLRRAFRKMLRFTSFIAFPLMFGISLIAPQFIVILIGEKWLPSAYLMQVLCVGGAFLPLTALYYNFIISRGKSNVYMWNVILQGCAILGSILLIHYWGLSIDTEIMGLHLQLDGIMVMVIDYVCILILWVLIWHYFVWREIRLPFAHALRDTLPFLFIAAVSMIGSYLVTQSLTNIYLLLVARIVVAVIFYVGIMWVSGAKIMRESINYILKR